METDCLINVFGRVGMESLLLNVPFVFGRVGMESLLLNVPFVCKSWHRASLNSLCWKTLIFPKIEDDLIDYLLNASFLKRLIDTYRIHKFSANAFIKSIIDRSHGNATALFLPKGCSEEAFKYVAEKCLSLEVLCLPSNLCFEQSLTIQEPIGKFKNLACLALESSFNLKQVLAHVSLNCHNLLKLCIINAQIEEDEVLQIVTLLPNITHLYLKGARVDRNNLVTILQGCMQLVYLDVRNCIGFDEDDDEILKLASFIPKFMNQGPQLHDYEDDDGYYWGIDHGTNDSD